jgi:hypothetical protein
MARFLEASPEDPLNEDETLETFEEEAPQIPTMEQPVEATQAAEQDDDDVPDKYKGKSTKDLARMHQEAEKLLGRQSSEVGELRKIVDDFVKSQIEAKNSPQEKVDEDIDFFSDPDKYVESKIQNHPSVRGAEEASLRMRKAEILNQLQTTHPDFTEIVSSEEFKAWKNASVVRQELFERADQYFDFNAANELLSLWKERQQIVAETAEMQKTDRKRQLKSASTGNAQGSSEAPSRKIYRRADIIKLMQTDPKRYTQLSDEIMAAYAEGRVR